jgi:succinyl-diaminopimelate desuccinylase
VDDDLNLDLDGPALTAALTDIASVSGAEGPLADAIERALGRLPHLSVTRHGNTLVARTALGRPERVVLAGHLDTVPHAGNFPSFWNEERTRLTGVGTSDMKAGVAVQLRLAAGLPEPSRDVTYVFYECEEVAGGCQGTLRASVTVAGLRAHTARSWRGRNAIHGAAEILEILRGWTPRQPVVDGLEYHEGLNAVAISGGVAGNVVPDSCVVTVNYRFAPDRSAGEAEDYIRGLFARWEVAVLDVAPGARPGLTEPLAAAFAAAVGGTPRAKLGWTDVARFAELGIPAVNYGPGISEIAHTPGEYVETAQITAAEARLRAWLSA